jgi:hypothetical protein
MPPVLAVIGAVLLVVGSVLGTLAVLTARANVRYGRRLRPFSCRLGPPTAAWRRDRARWRLRRTQAAWVGGVLLVRSGALRLWVTPLDVDVPRDGTIQALGPGDVRGLGGQPVALRFVLAGARTLEVAVAAEDADRLVGPFLTAALSGLPDAPRERGA